MCAFSHRLVGKHRKQLPESPFAFVERASAASPPLKPIQFVLTAPNCFLWFNLPAEAILLVESEF